MQYIDTGLELASRMEIQVDFVSERTSSSGEPIDGSQLFPYVPVKRVTSKAWLVNAEDELVFEIGQTGRATELKVACLWPFDCETSLRAIHLEYPKLTLELEDERAYKSTMTLLTCWGILKKEKSD